MKKKHGSNGHLPRIESVLRRTHTRFFRGPATDGAGRPVCYDTPLDELCAREMEAGHEAALDALEAAQQLLDLVELPAPLVERINGAALDAFRQYEETLMEWLFAAGPHPLDVLKRLYAYAKMKRASLLWNMSFRDLGELFGETHAAMHARCQALFGETPAGWRKKATARRNMAQAQQGNANRRGGRKAKRS